MSKTIITCAPMPPPHGGITNWYRIVQEEAQKRGYTLLNVDISPKKTPGQRSLFHRVIVQGFEMLKMWHQLVGVIRENRAAKAAHIATSGSLATIRDILFLRTLKKQNVKTVYHIHFGRIPDIFQKKNLEYRLISKAISLADITIVIDPKTYSVLISVYGIDRIQYVPNPVQIECNDTKEENREILFIGNVCKEKGIEELLAAWEMLFPAYPDWQLSVIGCCETAYETYLKKTYKMSGVELCGFLPHKDALEKLSESAFLVLPSYSEGFPNVILEAMMSGKAVLATDVGAVADMLCGDCGIVVPVKNVAVLIEKMEWLIIGSKQRRAMGYNGRRKVLEQYVADAVFTQYAAAWEA